ncbi:MAG: zinc ribbon domain-containing protein, partial [Conexivisphaerales archaeon]
LDASWGEFFQLLEYKAESAGVRVVKVNPRGTSEGLSYENPIRDWISANRIKTRAEAALIRLLRWNPYW